MRAPPQVLQGLQEGAPCTLLLQRRGVLLLHLRDLSEGDRLRLEASVAGAPAGAPASDPTLGDGQLLRELLRGGGHEVGWEKGEARGAENHLTHRGHHWKRERRLEKVQGEAPQPPPPAEER